MESQATNRSQSQSNRSDGGDISYTLDAHAYDSWWASTNRSASRNQPGIRDEERINSQPLLQALRIVQQFKIPMFRLDRRLFSAKRSFLGSGSSAVVEQSVGPMENSICPPYRDARRLFHNTAPNSEIYTDDQGVSWDPTTMVAYKQFIPDDRNPVDTRNEAVGLMADFLVLYLSGLRGHPNIVRPLGVSWVREEELGRGRNDAFPSRASAHGDGDHPRRSWPLVITERSSERSITHLMKTIRKTRSVNAILLSKKFRLCLDVLRGLKALHLSDIAHMDVKCDNAVVSGISEGTALNWQARLCDFNLAILDVSQQRQYSPDQLLGTPMYYPPEIMNANIVGRDNMFKIDIWCWGMLLWQVMVDNGISPDDDTNSPYLDENDKPISRTQLHDMKLRNNFNEIVAHSCTKRLTDQYEGEEGLLIPLVRDLLQQSLQNDATDRPTASELLDQSVKQLEELMPNFVEPNVPTIRLRTNNAIMLPQFDLATLYYNLLPFSRLPEMIVKELTELRDLANVDSDSTATEASFQIALCFAAGYGVEPDADTAVEILRQNAEGGHEKSQLALLPMAASLSIEVHPDHFEGCITSQARGGSFLAVSILAALYPEKSQSLPYKWPSNDDSQREALFLASHVGDLEFLRQAIDDGTILTARGRYGESSLHRAALCPEVEALRTIISLPGADTLIHACTSTSIKLFDDHSTIEYIPKNSTAFEWAVAVDNARAVERLIDRFGEVCITFNSLKQACMCLSFRSLKLMIEKLQGLRKWEDTLKKTRTDCTLLHWAIRPDYFRHLLSWNFNSYGARKCSLLHRQMSTIRVLIDAGSSWEAHVNGLFTPVHMLAAYGQPDTLKSFLSFASEKEPGLIDVKSKYGWRPIRDAMVRGRKASFDILLEHNAVLWAVDGQHHAAHVCAICEEDLAVDFAQEIVKRDGKCHKADGNYGGHPLHYAAQSGIEDLIRFWVNHNADLLAPNNDLFTPIGLAVWARSVRGVRALQHEYVRRRLPIRGISSSWAKTIVPNENILFGKSFTALAMLLAPGLASPKETRERLALPALEAGCNDLDWSFASRIIFKDLLDGYKEPNIFNKHFVDNLFASSQANSGIEHAIGYGNLPAFEELIKSDQFTYDRRSLLQVAVEELRYEEGRHPSPLQHRQKIFDVLLHAQEEHFENEKKRRCRPPSNLPWRLCSAIGWKIYYYLHGNLEQRMFLDCINWQVQNPAQYSRPQFLEFSTWPRFRYSFPLVHSTVVLILLLPLIIASAMLLSGQYGPENSDKIPAFAAVVTLTVVLAQWLPLFRVLCIQFDRLLGAISPDSRLKWTNPHRTLFQHFLFFAFLAMAVVNAHFLMSLRGLQWNLGDDSASQELKTVLETICGLLIAWIVIMGICSVLIRAIYSMQYWTTPTTIIQRR